MNLKFAIKSVAPASVREGDDIVRFSGNDEVFRNSCERACNLIGYQGFGPTKEPIVKFKTGLDEEAVEYYDWFTDEEKKEVKKFILENKERVIKAYGGEAITKDDNKDFWTSDKAWGRVRVDNYNLNQIRSTKDPKDCLLYLSIIAGAYPNLIAPTKEYAHKDSTIYFYLALEEDAVATDSESFVTKLEAQGALAALAKDTGDGMFILAWCLQYDSTSFGAYSRVMTSPKDLIKYHLQYIDGLINEKRGMKKSSPKKFIEYANLWNAPQTRAKLMVEAYVKAGEYYGLINKGKKTFQTREGTVLGNSIPEAVDTLMKQANADELDRLRDAVEKKWSE